MQKYNKQLTAERDNLLSFIRSKIRSLDDSEDMLQDVYIKALDSLNVMGPVDNLTGWLYTIAKNKVIDWYRKKRLQTVSLDEPIDEGLALKDILADDMDERWDDRTREAVYNALLQAISELPEKQRFVFIQNVIEERTFRELAKETGTCINTLMARKRYAVTFLRGRLKEIKQLIDN